MAAPWCFFARPGQVSKALAPEASLLLDLAAFYTADVPLTDQQAVVQDAFRSLWGVKPYTKQSELAQWLIFPLEPCYLFNLVTLSCQVVFLYNFLNGFGVRVLQVKVLRWGTVHDDAEPRLYQFCVVS